MNPIEIATMAFSFLKPFLKKGAEEISKESSKDLWLLIKSLFKKQDKEEITNKIEKEPENEDLLLEAQAEMAPLLYKDSTTKDAIEKELKKIVHDGIYQQITGDYGIAIGGIISNTTFNISQK